MKTVFIFPGSRLGIPQVIGQLQLLVRPVQDRVIPMSGLALFRRRHLVFPWELPGSLVAVSGVAALPWGLDESGVGAGRGGCGQLIVTERSAAHSAINAGALVFTTSLKTLSVLVHSAVILTCAPLSFGSTDALIYGYVVAIVTLQAFMVIAGFQWATVLIELSSAHLTAPTPIGHCTHTCRTDRGLCGALTFDWAASCHLCDDDCCCQNDRDPKHFCLTVR